MSALLALIVLVGFLLEGMRIAMTGWPDGAEYAFVGYGISLLLQGVVGLADRYGYLWYIHAVAVGIFVALIPFTRMSHIVTAPLDIDRQCRHRRGMTSQPTIMCGGWTRRKSRSAFAGRSNTTGAATDRK